MRGELSTLAQSLDIPLAYGASVVVPNVTKGQKSLIYRQLFRILHTTKLKAWEKQAVKRIVRVVRSTPHTMQTAFNKLSTTKDWCSTRPKCTCQTHLHTASQYGELQTIGDHVALISVRIRLLRLCSPCPPVTHKCRPRPPRRCRHGTQSYAHELYDRTPRTLSSAIK